MRCMLLALLLPCAADAEIHAMLSPEGRLVIADHAVNGSVAFNPLQSKASSPQARRRGHVRMPPPDLQVLFAAAAAETGVDADLLSAVALQESAYNPRAVSPAGAAGLMQLMPDTARRFGARDRFDAAQSVLAGAAYLAWLLRHFNQDVELALAAYNAGEGAVGRHGNRIPPFPETRAYVAAVLAGHARLTAVRNAGAADYLD